MFLEERIMKQIVRTSRDIAFRFAGCITNKMELKTGEENA